MNIISSVKPNERIKAMDVIHMEKRNKQKRLL